VVLEYVSAMVLILKSHTVQYKQFTYSYNSHTNSYTGTNHIQAHTQVHKHNKHRYSYIKFIAYKFMHYMHMKFSCLAYTRSQVQHIITASKSFNKIYQLASRRRERPWTTLGGQPWRRERSGQPWSFGPPPPSCGPPPPSSGPPSF
jgi:hypothetical protein